MTKLTLQSSGYEHIFQQTAVGLVDIHKEEKKKLNHYLIPSKKQFQVDYRPKTQVKTMMFIKKKIAQKMLRTWTRRCLEQDTKNIIPKIKD